MAVLAVCLPTKTCQQARVSPPLHSERRTYKIEILQALQDGGGPQNQLICDALQVPGRLMTPCDPLQRI